MSRRTQRLLPWIAGLVLVAGVVAVLVKIVPNSNPKTSPEATRNPVVEPATQKSVPLSKEARTVAGRFILTAVRRVHLDEAWKISGPEIRQTLTYKQWLTGSIPVVPYLAPISGAPLKVDYSFKDHALLEVVLVPAKGAKGAHSERFYLELKRVGSPAHWLVWSWVSGVTPPIPANPTGLQ